MAQPDVSPPLPALAFRVGVTGHRYLPDERLQELRRGLRLLLQHIRETVSAIGARHGDVYADGGNATLVVISPLARGADVLVAEHATSLGYKLDVPTPYDLVGSGSRVTGDESPPAELYHGARARFVLDGIDGDSQAYVEVGRRVVDNSDLLIAFWDGRPAAGPGGTAEIVRAARDHDIPVVHFHTERPGPITLWTGPDPVDAATIEGLLPKITRLLDLALAPPGAAPEGAGHQPLNLLRQYFDERTPRAFRRRTLGKAYAIFTQLVANPADIRLLRLPADPVAASREDWRENWDEARLPLALTSQIEHKLLEHFAWANYLSILYAIRYRSAFFWIYVLAFVAVGAAVAGHVADALVPVLRDRLTGCAPPYGPLAFCRWGARLPDILNAAAPIMPWSELAALLLILGLFFRGRKGKYHEKWVDYRSLAERIRHLSFLMPLGTTSPAIRVPVPAQHADPSSTWLNWLFRAIVRQAGLFRATVDVEYLAKCRSLLREHILRGQAAYHQRLGERLGKLHRRLHFLTIVLFGAALAVSLWHILTLIVPKLHGLHSEGHSQILFAAAVLLPTLGAAIHGFLSQGDFENVALRAESAHEQLARLHDEVGTLCLTSAERRVEIAQATRREQIAALDRESLLDFARRAVGERLDARQEPAVAEAVPDLRRHLEAWAAAAARMDDDSLRRLLENRPLRDYPPAASAELGRYARHVADIMGDDLIGWRADSQVRPLILA